MIKTTYFFVFVAFAINLSAQAFPDRHSTSFTDAWVSCQVTPSPNPEDPSGHWILYDLGNIYPLGQSTIWNYNDPKNLDRGINEYEIALSTDGTIWTSAGNFNLGISDGSAFYQGEIGPNLGDDLARYILITAISNYGGSCYGISELRINVDGMALPVELVDFNLDCEDNKVKITWSTESEVNNNYFEIQRSEDGKEWVALGKINGSENSNNAKSYSFEDNNPILNGFYRLRQQDFDGKDYFHDIKSIACGSLPFEILASPNPVYDYTNITLIGFNENGISYTLTDAAGKIWAVSERSLDEGNTFQIDLSQFPNGAYILNVRQDDIMIQQPLIKVGVE